MSQNISATVETTAIGQRQGVIVFTIGVVIMLGMMLVGYSIEDELRNMGMKALEEKGDPAMGLVLLFAFGFPLGVVASLCGAMLMGRDRWSNIATAVLAGVILTSLAAMVPAVFGRDISGIYFGTGGILILIAIAVSFWYWAQYRRTLAGADRKAADIKAFGYLCFALAAWNTCGLATMPSFGLEPKAMLAQGMQPFAVGQAKAIMAYFVLGWWFTAVGFYKSATHKKH